jgi:hypothetical protein
MNDMTPRFGLPFILPGQAQKEHFHNEALLRVDAILSAAAEGAQAEPPLAEPPPGTAWIVESPAQAAWAGREHSLAIWTAAGWRFVAPAEGMRVWNKAQALEWRWGAGAWTQGSVFGSALFINGEKVVGERQPGVPSPSGGTIIDAEARLTVDRVIVALKSHGLIE